MPLSLEEVRSVRTVDHSELRNIMRFGSYPAIVAAETVEEKDRILRNIATSYLYKDIFTFEKIKSPLHFELLLKLLAHQVGSTVSMNELAQNLAVSRATVEKYIRLLEQSYVIRRVHSFSRNMRNEIRKSFKVYFIDAGIRNAVIDDLRDVTERTDTGALFEQVFFSELLKESAIQTFGPAVQFWRTKQGLEIDFIVERAGDLRAYECKWGGDAVSFKTFLKLYPHAKTAVITPRDLL